MRRGFRKAIRTLLQLVAGGALTALVSAIAGGIESELVNGMILGAWTAVVAGVQNHLEEVRVIATLLPSPPAGTSNAPLVQPR